MRYLLSLILIALFVDATCAEEKKAPPKAEAKSGRPEEAQKLLVEALQLENDIQTAREKNLGGEVQRMARLIVENYEKVLKLCPADGEILVSYGAHLYNDGQYEQALAQYEKAVEAFGKAKDNAQLAQALYFKASTQYSLKKYDEALKTAGAALAVQPDHEEAKELKKSCEEHTKK